MEIENYREQSPTDKVVCIFDIVIPAIGMTIHEMKLRRSPKGATFLAYPSYGKENDMGEKKWFSYFSFTPERKKDFEKKIMELLEPYLK